METETEEQGVRQKLDSTPKANPVNRGNLRSQEPYSFICGVPKLQWLELRIHCHQDERRSDVSGKGVILAKHAKPFQRRVSEDLRARDIGAAGPLVS